MERERRSFRVSHAQWLILIEFLERNPSLLRGYNNTSSGRAQAAQLWRLLSNSLNAEGHGATKSPKEWAIYVSNHKSKLKKVVADTNADVGGTGGGPPRASTLSDLDSRFLAILGPGFGQTARHVSVNPFPGTAPSSVSQCEVLPQHEVMPENEAQHEPQPQHGLQPQHESPPQHDLREEHNYYEEIVQENPEPEGEPLPAAPTLPRRTRQGRYRTRPLAPLDEARRILAQVELQRAAADAASAQALAQLGQQVGRIADILERYLLRS